VKIVADENITALDEVFGSFGEIVKLPGREIGPDHVKDADALLVRSVTQVNRALIENSVVKFVGSCTIGTDHLDMTSLESMGVQWGYAPGCNANAVVDYVLACLVVLGEFDLEELASKQVKQTVGIVGCGNVGKRLYERLNRIGFDVLCCDPFVESAESFNTDCSLEKLLAESDIISLHVPLSKEGQYSSHYLLNSSNLSLLKQKAILINSSRGAVINNNDLLQFLAARSDVKVALDVWEGEPDINQELLDQVKIASPHIAGYSYLGKINGTLQVAKQFFQAFAVESENIESILLNDFQTDSVNLDFMNFQNLQSLVMAAYDPRDDDKALRAAVNEFDSLRKNYAVRTEFSQIKVSNVSAMPLERKKLLAGMGFDLN